MLKSALSACRCFINWSVNGGRFKIKMPNYLVIQALEAICKANNIRGKLNVYVSYVGFNHCRRNDKFVRS